jgi:hypothetical protein
MASYKFLGGSPPLLHSPLPPQTCPLNHSILILPLKIHSLRSYPVTLICPDFLLPTTGSLKTTIFPIHTPLINCLPIFLIVLSNFSDSLRTVVFILAFSVSITFCSLFVLLYYSFIEVEFSGSSQHGYLAKKKKTKVASQKQAS